MKKLFLVLISFFWTLTSSHTVEYKDIVRVGISDNNFSNLYYQTITVSATDEYVVYDKKTSEEIVTMPACKPLKIELEKGKLSLYSDNLIKNEIKDPIGIKTADYELLSVQGLKRGGKDALYRGEFEVSLSDNGHSGFNLINVIPLEIYLRGVVPNEMPVSFGMEALKAQTIAARNYTLRPRTVIYHNFDVCDSVQSQVYFGANTENPVSDEAVKRTEGLFALYDGKLILALYSSTAGGFTENYENVFLAPEWDKKTVEALPYLRGKADKECELNTDADIENFYSTYPDSHDIKSKFYRWEVSWDKTELEDILKKTLAQNAKSGFVSPRFKVGDFGDLQDIKVISRGVSGKAIAVEIQTDKDSFIVKKELIIRKVFKKNSKMLNSANIIVQKNFDEKGNLCGFKFLGGGFGHGVGMSQFGAGYMASHGASFDEILQHYYTGIAIGTFPAIVKDEKVTRKFYSPEGKGILIIESPKNVKNFTFIINDVEISLAECDLSEKTVINLDKFIKKENKIEFLPVDRDSLKVWIEVYTPKI